MMEHGLLLVPAGDEIMSLRQAAAFLSITEDTLYKLVGERQVPAFRLGCKGGRWRFRKSRLVEWMKAKEDEHISGGKPK